MTYLNEFNEHNIEPSYFMICCSKWEFTVSFLFTREKGFETISFNKHVKFPSMNHKKPGDDFKHTDK